MTFDADRSQVRWGNLPQVMAALRNTVIGLMRWAGYTNIAAACRRFAAQPALRWSLLVLHWKTEWPWESAREGRRASHLPATLCVGPGLCRPLDQGGKLAAPCQGRAVSLHTGRGSDVEWQHAGYALQHDFIFHANATVKGDHLVSRH